MNDSLEKLEQRTLHASIPLRAIVEMTYRCGFDCVHCYCDRSAPGEELSTAEMKDILRQLAESGTLVLTLTGGDILARSDFLEIARYARGLRFALRWFTNGSGWDERLAEEVRNLHPLSVDISLYGSCPDVYEAVTGDGENFSRVISGIHNLKRQGITLTLKLPVLAENYEDIPEMIRLCRKIDVSYTMSAHITPCDDGSIRPLTHTINTTQRRNFLSRYERVAPPVHRRPDDFLCNTARNSTVISPYGDIYPCVQIKKTAGNVRTKDFKSIWSSSLLLDELRRLRVKDLKECRDCKNLSSCPSCPGISFWSSGSFVARDHMACEWTHLRADLGLLNER